MESQYSMLGRTSAKYAAVLVSWLVILKFLCRNSVFAFLTTLSMWLFHDTSRRYVMQLPSILYYLYMTFKVVMVYRISLIWLLSG
jgi:hypothetical protein